MKNYNQLVVGPGCVVGDTNKEKRHFQETLMEYGFRTKYVEEFKTLPDNGEPDTGGRNDLLFYIHDADIPKFAIWRLERGLRWWEDYLDNGSNKIVPPEILEKYPRGMA
jgi:hypothetical protein